MQKARHSPYDFYERFFLHLSRLNVRDGTGIRNVVLSPGGRSAPLALLADANQNFKIWVHTDERAAAFFALGLAKAEGIPAVLICTSGTAATNYTPAVVEAYNSGTPLLILTADRPPDFWGKGMEQTIHQTRLYGKHLRFACQAPLIESERLHGNEKRFENKNLRAKTKVKAKPGTKTGKGTNPELLAETLAAKSLGPPPGPIHLNCPFAEPLEPPAPLKKISKVPANIPLILEGSVSSPLPGSPKAGTEDGGNPKTKRKNKGGDRTEGEDKTGVSVERAHLLKLITKHPRGLILVGGLQGGGIDSRSQLTKSIMEFAAFSGWPVVADGTSLLRFGNHPPSRSDPPLISSGHFLFSGADPFYSHNVPDVVLRIGAAPVSKFIRQTLNQSPPRHFLWCDPENLKHSSGFPPGKRLTADLLELFDYEALTFSSEAFAGSKTSQPEQSSQKATDSKRKESQSWQNLWQTADLTVRRILNKEFQTHTARTKRAAALPALTEPEVAHLLARHIPDKSILLLGNSQPIRDFDSFALPASGSLVAGNFTGKANRKNAKNIYLMANRGASGIDGLVATTLGTAASRPSSAVYLVLGDLSLLHDLNSLLTSARLGISLNIILINNSGGAIFENLEHTSKLKEHSARKNSFSRLFLTPSGISDFQFLGSFPGVSTELVSTPAQLQQFLQVPFPVKTSRASKIRIAEVVADNKTSSHQRRLIRKKVYGSLARISNDRQPVSQGKKQGKERERVK